MRRRVEVWSDTPDPFMEHFNDFLSVVEVLKSFRGLIAVDPNEPGVCDRLTDLRIADAADVAITTTFGPNTLQRFRVWAGEIAGST